jgi:hypothetical protein
MNDWFIPTKDDKEYFSNRLSSILSSLRLNPETKCKLINFLSSFFQSIDLNQFPSVQSALLNIKRTKNQKLKVSVESFFNKMESSKKQDAETILEKYQLKNGLLDVEKHVIHEIMGQFNDSESLVNV